MIKSAQELANALEREVSKVVIGKNRQIRIITAAILAEGHILLEDLPGVGKTTLVKSLSAALGCESKRVQFTPDLLPSDVTGMNIFDRQNGSFRRLQGPVMTNLLLADELNRAIPRTQSALLEAMEEKQVTLDGVTEKLPEPFVVLATQNPVETESTFRLPAAQMDRFLVCLSMGYPSEEEEVSMLKVTGKEIPYSDIQTICNPDDICAIQKTVQDVYVSDEVMNYMVSLIAKTRNNPDLRLGASPRATRAMLRICKAYASIEGRDYVTPDDVTALAEAVLCHRFMLSSNAMMSGKNAQTVLKEVMDSVPVPPQKEDLLKKADE